MKTTPNSVYLPTEESRGGFIGTREEGGQLETVGQKHGRNRAHMAAETRLGPRSAAMWARLGPCFWPAVSSWPPSSLVPIKTPLGSSVWGYAEF